MIQKDGKLKWDLQKRKKIKMTSRESLSNLNVRTAQKFINVHFIGIF